ncbi:hypothetical protein EVAR_5678_1 [Eumeta japonica]|uniref:Uncharacterized protein n=1 Tax=Eumeta variegata TaxID=151549 RepID=A0A4C1TAC1_EUMVA|nr:hypothetical protein EVAR_5678_1 [Eumeta japonica]
MVTANDVSKTKTMGGGGARAALTVVSVLQPRDQKKAVMSGEERFSSNDRELDGRARVDLPLGEQTTRSRFWTDVGCWWSGTVLRANGKGMLIFSSG